MKSIILSCLALICACNLYAQSEVSDKTGESFPQTVSFENQGKSYQLDLTGVATRKKLMFKVYNVAHYLQGSAVKGADPLQAILSDDNAKQLTLKWLRDVPLDKVRGGFEESLKANIPEPAYSKLKVDIDTFLAIYKNDVETGDVHIIRWIPSGIIEVEINGKPAGKLTNPEFAKGLWDIWFGSKNVVNRDNLLSKIK